MTTETISAQLDRLRRAVSYDVYDMTVRQLVDMVGGGEINIAPEYQRHFVWKSDRESELVESIFLGIPVPSLYMAANSDGTWEVVDGVQRLSTLAHFCGSADLIRKVGRADPLRLEGLQKLSSMNDKTFDELPAAIQLQFQLRPVRVTTLNDKSDFAVRYDLFERLNTGGVKLHPQEIRNCVIQGAFRDLLRSLALDVNFVEVVKLAETEQKSAIQEECVLRFFAYTERYQDFDHSVKEFLTDYMIDKTKHAIDPALIDLFKTTMAWLKTELPDGIVRGRQATPINLFEGVAVGAALAIRQNPNPPPGKLAQIMTSDELRKFTNVGTNTKRMVTGRIEYVRDQLLV